MALSGNSIRDNCKYCVSKEEFISWARYDVPPQEKLTCKSFIIVEWRERNQERKRVIYCTRRYGHRGHHVQCSKSMHYECVWSRRKQIIILDGKPFDEKKCVTVR